MSEGIKVKLYMSVGHGPKHMLAEAIVTDDTEIPRFLHDFADHLQAELAKERNGK